MKCTICKLHPKNPVASTNGCKHQFGEEKSKEKQQVKEVWLPYCPFCGQKVELPQGSPVGNMMINSCQFIADTDVCCFCRVCKKHLHLDRREPEKKN